jgi:hypothetical protein
LEQQLLSKYGGQLNLNYQILKLCHKFKALSELVKHLCYWGYFYLNHLLSMVNRNYPQADISPNSHLDQNILDTIYCPTALMGPKFRAI